MSMSQQETKKPAQRRQRYHAQNQGNPFPRIERGVKNERHQQNCEGHNERQAAIRALLALVLAGPIEVIAFRQLDLLAHLLNRLSNRAAQVASAHTVLDGDVSPVALAVNGRGAVFEFDLAQLSQRNPLTGGGQNAYVGDVFNGCTKGRLVANRQIVALFPDQNLAYRLAANRSLHRILYIPDVHSE